jgi:aspartyl-tRNA synthetase
VDIVNAVKAKLPFIPADEEVELKEEVRLRHRVLDLRCSLLAWACTHGVKIACGSAQRVKSWHVDVDVE